MQHQIQTCTHMTPDHLDMCTQDLKTQAYAQNTIYNQNITWE